MSKLLIIDDEQTILESLSFILELEGFEIITCLNGKKGIEIFKNSDDISAVITDMKMPGLTGIDVLETIKKINPETGVIILTGHGDMDNAIKAMKIGAFDYLNKPVNADKLIITINNAISKRDLYLENKKLQQKLIKKNEYLQGLQDSAEKILLRLIPKEFPNYDFLKIASEYKSFDIVGGDMYDVFDLGNYVYFYIFDVASHGILASVITILLKSFFDSLKYHNFNINDINNLPENIKLLNKELISNTPDNIFASLFMGYINKDTKELNYVSAGHIPQYIIRDQNIIELESTGTILGFFDKADFEMKKVSLKKSDKLFLFTDGIVEVWSDNKMLGEDKIKETLISNKDIDINSLINIVKNTINEYSSGKRDDDMTMLGLEII